MRRGEDAIMRTADGAVADFIGHVWFVANAFSELDRVVVDPERLSMESNTGVAAARRLHPGTLEEGRRADRGPVRENLTRGARGTALSDPPATRSPSCNHHRGSEMAAFADLVDRPGTADQTTATFLNNPNVFENDGQVWAAVCTHPYSARGWSPAVRSLIG
jgi:hypothetical protein